MKWAVSPGGVILSTERYSSRSWITASGTRLHYTIAQFPPTLEFHDAIFKNIKKKTIIRSSENH